MKAFVSRGMEWEEIKNIISPMVDELVYDDVLENDDKAAALEVIVRAFVLSNHMRDESVCCRAHAFDFLFSAVADIDDGEFTLYRKIV